MQRVSSDVGRAGAIAPARRLGLTWVPDWLPLRWVIFGTLSLSHFLIFFQRVAPNVLAPDLSRAFQLSASELGLLGSVYFWVYAALQVPIGILLDRLGARRLGASAMILAALGSALVGLAPGLGVALLGRAFVGIGSTPFYISIMLVIRNWFRRREFATMAGVMLTVSNLGGLAATQPLARLAETAGWRESLVLLAAVMLGAALLLALCVRSRPEEVGLPPLGEVLAPDVGERLPLARALRIAWGVRSVWLIAAMFFLMYGVVNAFQGLWAVPWLIDTRGLSRPEAAIIQSWWAWGTVVGALAWGLLSDRVLHTRKGTGLLGFVLFALAWAPMTLLPALPLWTLTPLMFLAGFGSASVIITSPIVMELLPRQVVGTAIGLVNATPFLGAAAYQYGIGLALDAFGRAPSGAYLPSGYQAVFAFCLVSILGATLLMLPVRERGR